MLIVVSLLALLLAVGAFYFDQWMWGDGRHRSGEVLGKIVGREGDVRLKYEGDLRWSKAGKGQDLLYNDAIYSGAGSQADLLIGKSKLKVAENTLIVLRRENTTNFLNLNYGTMFGKIAKGDKVVIDTGDGKPIEFRTDKGAEIVLRRTDGKTRLDLTAGEAEITVDGQTRKMTQASRAVFGDDSPAKLRPGRLRIVKPKQSDLIVSENPERIDFEWAWDNGRTAMPNERYTLEFSADDSFKNIHITKQVHGALRTSMSVSQSLGLFFRVRSGDEISPTRRLGFMRLEKPVIVSPLANQRFVAPKDRLAGVPLQFKRPQDASVWYQIAADPEFKQILFNHNVLDVKLAKEFEPGSYFLRAKADFGNKRITSWTETRIFHVDRALEVFPLVKRHLPSRVIIPNEAYPAYLYEVPPEQVKSFLAERGLLRRFFPFKEGEVGDLKIAFKRPDTKEYMQKNLAWPEEKLYPGRYEYGYQANKDGYLPSPWFAGKKLEIVMAPPKPLGDAEYGELDQSGRRQATWNFTPILFAKSYDVEVATNEAFFQAQEFRTYGNQARAQLPEGEYYWRARARDSFGRIISPFSRARKLKSMPMKVPQFLAKSKRQENLRKPAQASERTSARRERLQEKPWQRSGWWAWLGSGVNYVNYRQSIPSRGTLEAYKVKAGSQYFEGGFYGGNGLGGVFTYKNTPGEFTIENLPIYPSKFNWTTTSLEGTVRKTSAYSVWDSSIVYGMRAGIQQHTIPFLFLPAEADRLLLKNNQMTTASAGLLGEITRRRWMYHWLMRYQFPMSSKADGSSQFNMSPVFAFDGSIGASYNITQQSKIGLFWYGQWHQFNFVYGDGDISNSGFQSLFYSNIDLRFGMDF